MSASRQGGVMLDQRAVLAVLKAAAEPTRLRLLMLLRAGELNVKDLTRILGQSQPRISRHLKLMAEAGLIERLADGSWAYYHLIEQGHRGALIAGILDAVAVNDPVLVRDSTRADGVKREREAAAQAYFQAHAAEWDRIRTMHVKESDVEAALSEAVGAGPFGLLVDLGTGTGRVLELLADRYTRAIGFDINHSMLAYARGKLDAAGLDKAMVRHGDLYDLALGSSSADAVVMHQVLHFLAEPALAVREAARILAPGGRLVIIDFAPHEMEFLRDAFAHERLGFSTVQVEQWMTEYGLEPEPARVLAPDPTSDGDKLTVTVWTARRLEERPTVRRKETLRSVEV
jgi:ubiquinone/menaquinone biosynthesis C-methylase UbiE/DNA-binding transcriptional ArsR family regulator